MKISLLLCFALAEGCWLVRKKIGSGVSDKVSSWSGGLSSTDGNVKDYPY